MPPRRFLALGLALLALAATPLVAAAAGPYPPPSTGSATVHPSRIKAGQCTTFTGDGFATGTAVAVADDGAPAGTARADRNGAARLRLCFGTDARTGQHVISGTGATPAGSAQTVSAVLTITGVEQTASGQAGGAATGTTGGTGPSTSGAAAPGAVLGLTDPQAAGVPDLSSAPRTDRGGVRTAGAGGGVLSLHGVAALASVLGLLLVLVAAAWLLLLLGRRRSREHGRASDLQPA
jgi:hypothetical protein